MSLSRLANKPLQERRNQKQQKLWSRNLCRRYDLESAMIEFSQLFVLKKWYLFSTLLFAPIVGVGLRKARTERERTVLARLDLRFLSLRLRLLRVLVVRKPNVTRPWQRFVTSPFCMLPVLASLNHIDEFNTICWYSVEDWTALVPPPRKRSRSKSTKLLPSKRFKQSQ